LFAVGEKARCFQTKKARVLLGLSHQKFIQPTKDATQSQVNSLSAQILSGYIKIAIENGLFIVDLPIKDGDFPYQTVS